MLFQRPGKPIDPESFDHKILEIDLGLHKFHPIETSEGELFGVLWCHPIGRRDKVNSNDSHQCGQDYEHCEIMFMFEKDQHRFTSIDPVTIFPSLVCTNCRAHGWLEEGAYVGDRFSEMHHRLLNVTKGGFWKKDIKKNGSIELSSGRDVVAVVNNVGDAEFIRHAKDDMLWILDKLSSYERHYLAPHKTWAYVEGKDIAPEYDGCLFDVDVESIFWDEAVVMKVSPQGNSVKILREREITPELCRRDVKNVVENDPWNLIFKDKSKFTFEDLEAKWGPAPAIGHYVYFVPPQEG